MNSRQLWQLPSVSFLKEMSHNFQNVGLYKNVVDIGPFLEGQMMLWPPFLNIGGGGLGLHSPNSSYANVIILWNNFFNIIIIISLTWVLMHFKNQEVWKVCKVWEIKKLDMYQKRLMVGHIGQMKTGIFKVFSRLSAFLNFYLTWDCKLFHKVWALTLNAQPQHSFI